MRCVCVRCIEEGRYKERERERRRERKTERGTDKEKEGIERQREA